MYEIVLYVGTAEHFRASSAALDVRSKAVAVTVADPPSKPLVGIVTAADVTARLVDAVAAAAEAAADDVDWPAAGAASARASATARAAAFLQSGSIVRTRGVRNELAPRSTSKLVGLRYCTAWLQRERECGYAVDEQDEDLPDGPADEDVAVRVAPRQRSNLDGKGRDGAEAAAEALSTSGHHALRVHARHRGPGARHTQRRLASPSAGSA